MKYARCVLAVLLVLCAVRAEAQVAPSSYTPLAICAVFDAPLTAGSTAYFLARGTCNIPPTANAVALIAEAVCPSANGEARVWESSLPTPALSSMNFRKAPGSDSSLLIVRLCYPLDECAGEDLAVQVTKATRIVLKAVGYFEPLVQ
jgi:hypothetical protein